MLSKIISEGLVQKSHKLISRAEHIVITTHVSPDGDAIGASLGLYHFLKKQEKEVTIVVPNRFPSFLNWLSESDHIVIMEELQAISVRILQEADLIFCLDFNALNRVNGIKPLIEQSKASKIMIDHHPYPEDFCDVTISHPEISSTSELVFRLICRMGYFGTIDLHIAQAIYTGMMTDTGNFSYNSNHPEIYSIIKELILKGIDKDDIYRKVYNTSTADRLRLMGYLLADKMELYDEYHTAIMSLSLEEQNRFNFVPGDAEGFVNIPLQIEHIDCSIFLKEDKDKVKISFRSQGSFPVNRWAALFNGGGHLNAAGGESYASVQDTMKRIKEVVANRAELEAELVKNKK